MEHFDLLTLCACGTHVEAKGLLSVQVGLSYLLSCIHIKGNKYYVME